MENLYVHARLEVGPKNVDDDVNEPHSTKRTNGLVCIYRNGFVLLFSMNFDGYRRRFIYSLYIEWTLVNHKVFLSRDLIAGQFFTTPVESLPGRHWLQTVF